MARKVLSRKAAFSEVFADEPSIVAKTRRTKGKAAARRQKIAIALSKSRSKAANRRFREGRTRF